MKLTFLSLLKLTLGIFVGLGLAHCLSAGPVSVVAVKESVPFSTSLAASDVTFDFQYGTLDRRTLEAAKAGNLLNREQILSGFNPLGAVRGTSSGEFFDLDGQSANVGAGQQLFALVTASDSAGNTEWGFFSSSSSMWRTHDAPGGSLLSSVLIDQIFAGQVSNGTFALTAGERVAFSAIEPFSSRGLTQVASRGDAGFDSIRVIDNSPDLRTSVEASIAGFSTGTESSVSSQIADIAGIDLQRASFLNDAVDLGDGWLWNEWLEFFWLDQNTEWAYHMDFGWFYAGAPGARFDSAWFYLQDFNGWFLMGQDLGFGKAYDDSFDRLVRWSFETFDWLPMDASDR